MLTQIIQCWPRQCCFKNNTDFWQGFWDWRLSGQAYLVADDIFDRLNFKNNESIFRIFVMDTFATGQKSTPNQRQSYATVTHSRVTNRIWCGWKMSRNSLRIHGNLHTVLVEKARYSFYLRIWKLSTGIWKGQVRVGRSCCGSKRVNKGWTECHKLFLMLCVQSHTAGFRTGSIQYQNCIDPVSPA
jgi:hypothetical protein